MEKKIQFLLNYMDGFNFMSSQDPPRSTIDNGIKMENDKSHVHNASKIVRCVSTKNNMALNDSPIKTEIFDEWNEEKKYNRYRRDSDISDSRERRGISRSRERLKSCFRQRSRNCERRGRSKRRFSQRSRSRESRGRSNSGFDQQSRRRDSSVRSKSRFCQQSKSRGRRGRSKSIDEYHDRTSRSEYSRSDQNAHDNIDKHNSSNRENLNNSSMDRYVSRQYDGRSDRRGSRVYKRENRHELIDAYSTITYKYKYNKHKQSSTVTYTDIKKSAAHFNDTSQTDEPAESLKYQQKKDANDREKGMRSQYQMEQETNPNNLQSRFSSLPTNLVRRNPFATDVPNATTTYGQHKQKNLQAVPGENQVCRNPFATDVSYQNYARNVSDYRSPINDNVELPKYRQSSSTNATTAYDQHEQQHIHLQVSPSENKSWRNPFATDVPHQNYARNLSDNRFSINDDVELRKYHLLSSSNATATYGQHKQQNVQGAPGVSKIDISKSHLDKFYRSREYSIPSLYSTNSKLSQKFRIPKKNLTSTVTKDIHYTGNYSMVASESRQSNRRGGYDFADLQYELSEDIDQLPNKTTTIDNSISKKPSLTDESVVKASSPILPKDQTTVKKEEEIKSLCKMLVNPSSLFALINLCAKTSDAGKSNEMIQPPTTRTNPVDTSGQKDINSMTTTEAEKIVKVKKSKRKRSIWLPRRKSKRNSRCTKAASQNEANSLTDPLTNKNIKQKATLKDDVTKQSADTEPKVKADALKPEQPYEPASSIFYSLRRRQNTAVSSAVQEVNASEPPPKKLRKVPKSNKQIESTIVADHLPAKRVKRARIARERDITLNKLEQSDSDETLKPSDSDESFSSTAGTRTIKNKKRKVFATANRRRLSANRKRIASEMVPELDLAGPCRGSHTKDDKNRREFNRADDVKPKTEPSTIKNNNAQWHCMNQKLECLHCDKNTGTSLANHYINKHPGCEVFSCRLPPDIAEFLRNTTEGHKCERRKQEGRQLYEFRQRCYFCDKLKRYTKVLWLQHYSVHTGCYEFQCTYCRSTFSSPKKDHDCIGKNNCVRKIKYPPFHRRDGIIYGYVCDLCNFIRFEPNEIEKHLRCEHEGEVDGKFKKLVLLTFPKIKKKHEIKAEQLANAIKAATENESLDPLISNDDDDDIAIVIKTEDDNNEVGYKTPRSEADIDGTRTIEENMPNVILDSDDDWTSFTDDDESNDNVSTNLQPSTSTQAGYVAVLPEIISQVEEVIIETQSDSQTTESLDGMSQQQNDMVSPINQSTREVPDANIEESKSVIDDERDAATAYKKIVIEETTNADNKIADLVATNFSSINGCSLALNATSNPESEYEKCATVSLNDSISSNMNDDTVYMNCGIYVQTKIDSDPVTTVQPSPETAFPPFVETDFLNTSLLEQSSSSPTPNEFELNESELTDIACISNEIVTNDVYMEIKEELAKCPNTVETFTDKINNFRTLSFSTKTQDEIDNAANNLVNGTGLTGSDLYRCCDCDEKYTDKFALKMHLLSHDQSLTNLKCYHCPVACNTIDSLMTHIESHGIHRYFCWYCLYTNATLYNVFRHMQEAHEQDKIDSIPLNPYKTDESNDLFVVYPTRLKEEVLVRFALTLIERNGHKLLS